MVCAPRWYTFRPGGVSRVHFLCAPTRGYFSTRPRGEKIRENPAHPMQLCRDPIRHVLETPVTNPQNGSLPEPVRPTQTAR
jgi:hypothetical protein